MKYLFYKILFVQKKTAKHCLFSNYYYELTSFVLAVVVVIVTGFSFRNSAVFDLKSISYVQN